MKSFSAALALAFVGLLLCAASIVQGKAQMTVEGGWGGRLRSGRWAPVFVTASDSVTRNAVLEISWPQGGNYVMRIRQHVTIGPAPRTFPILAPVHGWGYQEATFTLSDENGKGLAHFPGDDGANQLASPSFDAGGAMVGVSGRRSELQGLKDAVPNTSTGYLEPDMVPEAAIGFDSLELLVLNEPDLVQTTQGPAALSDAQQQAIVDWVKAGGNLLLWPGDAGFPDSSRLAGVLPAKVGQRENIQYTRTQLNGIGLPVRYQNLAVFKLDAKPGARKIDLLNDGQISAYGWRVGLGQIVLSPVNVSGMPVPAGDQTRALWEPLVKGMIPLAAEQTVQTNGRAVGQAGTFPGAVITADQRESNASMEVANFLGNVPGAAQIGFTYIAVVLIGMMIVVGPLDWFVLKRLGRQPWTWITTGGWIALVTFGAIFVGYLFKSGQLHYRTLRTADQIGDTTVATTDYVGLYAPRTREYAIDPSEGGWWQPAGVGDYGGGGGLKLDMDFHQMRDSNTPEPMLVNVWSLRFLRGDQIAAAPPMISAKLSIEPDASNKLGRKRVTGTLTNLMDRPLRDFHVMVKDGTGDLKLYAIAAPSTAPAGDAAELAEIPAHATVRVTASIAPEAVAATQYAGAYYQQAQGVPEESQLWKTASGLNARREVIMKSLLSTGKFAIIHAQAVKPPPVAKLMGQPEAIEANWEFIRAVVELGTPERGK
ncbi:MAG TPA: hypothetical protein VFC78_25085 [Tepidisphaeraceae bacterium]|nr:hypothetical protein [Tepidisphaeraceae bacterium]